MKKLKTILGLSLVAILASCAPNKGEEISNVDFAKYAATPAEGIFKHIKATVNEHITKSDMSKEDYDFYADLDADKIESASDDEKEAVETLTEVTIAGAIAKYGVAYGMIYRTYRNEGEKTLSLTVKDTKEVTIKAIKFTIEVDVTYTWEAHNMLIYASGKEKRTTSTGVWEQVESTYTGSYTF